MYSNGPPSSSLESQLIFLESRLDALADSIFRENPNPSLDKIQHYCQLYGYCVLECNKTAIFSVNALFWLASTIHRQIPHDATSLSEGVFNAVYQCVGHTPHIGLENKLRGAYLKCLLVHMDFEKIYQLVVNDFCGWSFLLVDEWRLLINKKKYIGKPERSRLMEKLMQELTNWLLNCSHDPRPVIIKRWLIEGYFEMVSQENWFKSECSLWPSIVFDLLRESFQNVLSIGNNTADSDLDVSFIYSYFEALDYLPANHPIIQVSFLNIFRSVLSDIQGEFIFNNFTAAEVLVTGGELFKELLVKEHHLLKVFYIPLLSHEEEYQEQVILLWLFFLEGVNFVDSVSALPLIEGLFRQVVQIESCALLYRPLLQLLKEQFSLEWLVNLLVSRNFSNSSALWPQLLDLLAAQDKALVKKIGNYFILNNRLDLLKRFPFYLLEVSERLCGEGMLPALAGSMVEKGSHSQVRLLDECIYDWLLISYHKSIKDCLAWAVLIDEPFIKMSELIHLLKRDLIQNWNELNEGILSATTESSNTFEIIGNILLLLLHFVKIGEIVKVREFEREFMEWINSYLVHRIERILLQGGDGNQGEIVIFEIILEKAKPYHFNNSFYWQSLLQVSPIDRSLLYLRILEISLQNLSYNHVLLVKFSEVLICQFAVVEGPIYYTTLLRVLTLIYGAETPEMRQNLFEVLTSKLAESIVRKSVEENLLVELLLNWIHFLLVIRPTTTAICLDVLLKLSRPYWDSQIELFELFCQLLLHYSGSQLRDLTGNYNREIVRELWSYCCKNPSYATIIARWILALKHKTFEFEGSNSVTLGSIWWQELIRIVPSAMVRQSMLREKDIIQFIADDADRGE